LNRWGTRTPTSVADVKARAGEAGVPRHKLPVVVVDEGLSLVNGHVGHGGLVLLLRHRRVEVLRPAEKQDVGLRSVRHVVLPPEALLDAEGAPLHLRQQDVLRDQLGDLLGQDDVPVLVHVVGVLVRVDDLVAQRTDQLLR